MKVVTWEQVNRFHPCAEAVAWGHQEFNGAPVQTATVFRRLHATDHWPWANWLLARLLNRPNQIRYAVYAAKQVLSIYEKKYPTDKRPRAAIQAAIRCIEHDTPENRRAADAAKRNALRLRILRYGQRLLRTQEATG